MISFNLENPAQWDALGAAWRVARARWYETLTVYSAREERMFNALRALPEEVQREHKPALKSIHSVDIAEAEESAACDLDGDLVDAALAAPAPSLAAFMLKLEMISDPNEWNAFDNETWPIFLADVRRFALASSKEAAQ